MNKSNVIFEHECNNYKLMLDVYDYVNDCKQHCFIAELKLYTNDNLLMTGERYLFPKLASKLNHSITLAYDAFLDHLQSRFLPSTLAYDLYLKYTRELKEA